MVLGELPRLNISYKPQKISPKSQCQVRMLLQEKIRDAFHHSQVIRNGKLRCSMLYVGFELHSG